MKNVLLLVHDDPEDVRTAWFGPELHQVAVSARELVDLGYTDVWSSEADGADINGLSAAAAVSPASHQPATPGGARCSTR